MQCFFSDNCQSYSDISYYNSELSDSSTLYGIKVPSFRGQLSAGVLMVVSSIIYFIVYGVTASRARDTSVLVRYPYNNYKPTDLVVSQEIPAANIQLKCPYCQTIFPVAAANIQTGENPMMI